MMFGIFFKSSKCRIFVSPDIILFEAWKVQFTYAMITIEQGYRVEAIWIRELRMRTRRKDQEVIFMVFNILSTRELVPVPLQTSRIQQHSQPHNEISLGHRWTIQIGNGDLTFSLRACFLYLSTSSFTYVINVKVTNVNWRCWFLGNGCRILSLVKFSISLNRLTNCSAE